MLLYINLVQSIMWSPLLSNHLYKKVTSFLSCYRKFHMKWTSFKRPPFLCPKSDFLIQVWLLFYTLLNTCTIHVVIRYYIWTWTSKIFSQKEVVTAHMLAIIVLSHQNYQQNNLENMLFFFYTLWTKIKILQLYSVI